MSAAEKLKELGAASSLEKYEIDLFPALPTITLLVEFCESIIGSLHFQHGSIMAQLLRELEEKLP